MPIEPNETERTGELRMFFRQLVEDTKRLHRIGDFREDAPLSVIHEEEALHSFPLTQRAPFLTRERGCVSRPARASGASSSLAPAASGRFRPFIAYAWPSMVLCRGLPIRCPRLPSG